MFSKRGPCFALYPRPNAGVEQIQFGAWEFSISSEVQIITVKQIDALENWVNDVWKPAYLACNLDSWGGLEEGYISPVVRIDGLPPATDFFGTGVDLSIFEVEAQPEGLGIIAFLIQKYGRGKRLEQWKATFQALDIAGIVNLDHPYAQDDSILAEQLGIPYSEDLSALGNSGLFWIRTGTKDWPELNPKSVAPLGCAACSKMYLVRLDLATLFNNKRLNSLPWDAGFVAKPLFGSRCRGVYVYLPPRKKRKFPVEGFTRRSKIEEFLSQARDPYIYQSFFPPVERLMSKKAWRSAFPGLGDEEERQIGYQIWRTFLLWDFLEQRYRFGGGAWVWRPNIKVHGAKDGVVGLVDV